MKHFYSQFKKILNVALFLGIFLQSFLGNSQTTLVPGDIAFTGYDATQNATSAATSDTFSFVLLKDISATTTISFTDRGYTGSAWFVIPNTSTTEGTITWTCSSALAAGTEVTINGLSASAFNTTTSTSNANGTVTYNSAESNIPFGLSLSTGGDQIIAFQGGGGSITGGVVTLISGISYSRCNANTTEAGWDDTASCSIGPTSSTLPPGLINGTSAFYTGTVSGTTIATSSKFNGTGTPFLNAASARTALMNQANWIKATTAQTLPTGYIYIGTIPIINIHPTNKTICTSTNTSFAVTALNATSYQWQVNTGGGFGNISDNATYSGTNNSTLSIIGATSAMNGYQYRCVATNSSGSVNSNAATLTVPTVISPSVTANIPSVYGANNGTATVTVSGGTSPYTYSWSPAGGSLATSTPLAPGNYIVTITDNTPNGSGGCSVTQPVTITESPGSSTSVSSLSGFTTCAGSTSTPQSFALTAGQLTANLDLSPPTGYEISTTSGGPYFTNLSLTPSSGNINRTIYVRLAATATGTPAGNITISSTGIPTKNVALSGTVNPLSAITSEPSSNTTCIGGNATFSITASNATGYKWQVDQGGGFNDVPNNAPYSGVTSSTLTITGATAAMNGYLYRGIATGNCIPAISNNALLTINPAPAITAQPSSTSVCLGDNVAFSVTASNATGYQWYVDKGAGFNSISNDAQFSGATTATLTITGVTAQLGGYLYRVVATGGCFPNATSNNATLTINSAPSITAQPSASSVCQGANTTFTATASNATGYQWQVDQGLGFIDISNNATYSGATAATLTITGATVAMSGYIYRAIVSGTCTPTATSNSASLTVNSAPAITANPSSISICSGGTTAFSATASNATAYKWQVDQGGGFIDVPNTAPYSGITTSTLTITGAPAGFNGYKYRAVASGSCTPSATSNTATLTVNHISIIMSKVDVACFGDTTGQATATPSGGTGNYTYSWSNGADTATITGLAAGTTYTVTVTDENLCSNTANVTIGQPASALTLTKGTVNNTSCHGGGNGTAQVIALGGTPNYSYSWNTTPIQTTATASGLSAGTYTVTVKDANQCVKTLEFTISEPPAFTITPSQTNISCNGGSNGSATVSVTGGTGAYTYNWSTGAHSTTISGLMAGTYTVTIIDANNCQASQSFTFIDPPILDATQSQTDVLCNGGATGTATVTASGGSGNLTYFWSPSGGSAATATGLSAGTYTCKITDANSCFITKTFIIGEPSALNATTTQVDATCSTGGEATVTPSGGVGGYSYSWSPSGGIAATASGLVAGTYNCTITDGNGCSILRSVTINTTNTLVANTGKTDVLCNGASTGSAWVIPSGAAGPFTYEWTPNVGNTDTVNGLTAGSYSVKIIAGNGCSIIKNFTITEPSAIVITPGAKTNVSCNGGNNGSASVSAIGGTGAYTYSWDTTPAQSTATATGLKAGTYTVTVTDANSCSKTQSITITEPDALIATTSQTDVSCNGGSNGTATVNVTGGTGLYTYSWSPSGGTNATASGLSAGTYTVTIKDANLCQTTASVTITEPSALTATIAKTDVLCNQANNGTATVTPSGGTGTYTYSWSPSGGTAATATGLSPNTYTVTVTDENGCFVTKSVLITEPTALSATDTHTNVSCKGGNNGTASVIATGGTGAYTYSWAPSGGNAATATGLIAGTYTVTVTDENSCSTTNTISITEPDALTLNATPVAVSCHNGNNGSATVSVTGGTGAYSYSWAPSGGNAATATGLVAGTYTVTVTDDNSCSASATVEVTQPTNPVNLNTAVVSGITTTSASLSGTASSNGINTDSGSCLTEVGFVYAQHANPTTADTKINITAALGTFTNSLSGLRGNRTYYVRTYAINNNGFINYGNEVSFTTQKYTLTIAASAGHTKVYGTVDPVFNYTALGFANGDTNSILTGLLTRDAGENVGKYNIKLGTINAGADYTIAFTGAEFEITKANQTITWNQTLEFGCADSNNVALTATTDSGLPVSYAIANAALGTISGSTLNITGSGNSTITATQNGDQNHNAATAVIKPIEISQSGLVIQQWANVLFFDNRSNNFVAWQWYKNGTAISGATRQYYSEIQPLNGTYHVIAKDKNGNSIKSCPIETSGTVFSKKIKIYPNPVKPGGEFTLECDFSESQLSGSEVVIYDIAGKLVQTISNVKAKNQIIAPSQTALYIVVLKLADGQLKTINLLVK
ncbi:MBG domain-containing protein [Flavobacterium sharifuzzamanii]|uniref:MBG domain-containing protein n=1 Tax=Flavobacterium sharifuzzamanii TaxID=2211133 RepID=UPI000DABB3FB|nr:MBG domain-containing protein [Flavobacterium sharifuzzamanii]KAF2082457.1 T9SS type A sorting domain-containing protein [Flavobacterium sharifuzzamanii]